MSFFFLSMLEKNFHSQRSVGCQGFSGEVTEKGGTVSFYSSTQRCRRNFSFKPLAKFPINVVGYEFYRQPVLIRLLLSMHSFRMDCSFMIACNWKSIRRKVEDLVIFFFFNKRKIIISSFLLLYELRSVQLVEEGPSQNDADYVYKAVLCWVSYYESSFPSLEFDKLLGFGF